MIHAFTQDPDTNVFRQLPLCQAGLVASTGRGAFGKQCPACERALKFLGYTANRYIDIGRKQGAATARVN